MPENNRNNSSSSSGMGCLGVVGVVLVTLKLTGNLNWSWWYVTAPWWGPLLLTVAVFVFVFVVKLAAHVFLSTSSSVPSFGRTRRRPERKPTTRTTPVSYDQFKTLAELKESLTQSVDEANDVRDEEER